MFRVGLLALVILAGLLFHHQGHAYDAIRVVYYVFIVAFLLWGISMRRGRGPLAGGRGGPSKQVPIGTKTNAPGPTSAGPAAGWYAEAGQAGHERYWDGQSWGARRRLEGSEWVVDG